MEHIDKINELNPTLLTHSDASIKLYAAERLRANNAKKNSDESILEHGKSWCKKEQKKFSKSYRFFSKTSYTWVVLYSLIICFFMFNQSAQSSTDILIILIMMPITVLLINDARVSLNLARFSPKNLEPKVTISKKSLPTVSVILPSRNEPFAVAKMTFDSALALDYPKQKLEIIVVDNSDESFSELDKWREYVNDFSKNNHKENKVTVKFIHREGTYGFKPHNLDIALEKVNADLVLFLDIDSTLKSDTLLRTTHQFSLSKKLGFIQLYTIPTNYIGNSILALANGISGYFQRLSLVLSTHGSNALFFGHNAIWKREALNKIGSVLEFTNDEVLVAEDFSMSIRAAKLGYHGKSAWVMSGEWVPTSMVETEAMWLRWTVGTLQVFIKHFCSLKDIKLIKTNELMGWLQHVGLSISLGLFPLLISTGLLIKSQPILLVIALGMFFNCLLAITAVIYKNSLFDSTKNIFAQCYLTFFVLPMYINWIRCIGNLRYVFGVKQGWKPTGKGCEDAIPLVTVIKQRWGMLLFSISASFYSLYLLTVLELSFTSILIALTGLSALNLGLSVVFFGFSRTKDTDKDAVKKYALEQHLIKLNHF